MIKPAFPRTLALLGAAVLLPLPAAAHHYNRGHFVRAYAACESPNTVTTAGIPACAPAALLSDCAADPAGALQLDEPATSSITMMLTGRRHTRAEDGQLVIESRFAAARVLRCDGSPYSGDVTVRVTVRMQRDDPACATGVCTLPDFNYHHTVPCVDGSCRSVIEDPALDLPELPNDHGFAFHVVRVAMLDLSGNEFLADGMAFGEGLRELSPLEVSFGRRLSDWIASALSPADAVAYGATGRGSPRRLTARQVRAFEACDPGSTDTTTSEGLPACSTVFLSNCDDNPLGAVVPRIPETGNFTDAGKGKLDIAVLPDSEPLRLKSRGAADGLDDCSGAPYEGNATVAMRVKATLLDAACPGGTCTTVPTTMISGPVESIGGQIGKLSIAEGLAINLSTGPAVTAVSAEILEVEIQDGSGNAFMFGPSLLARCNYNAGTPNEPGGEAFCFGN